MCKKINAGAFALASVVFPQVVSAVTVVSPPMVVTATRMEGLLSLPANVTVISAEEIKRSPSRTLPELLSEETGVSTTSLFSHGSRASVGIRGFGETATQNTLILLDGRRLNDIDLSSVNFSAIPFENIERIEIVRGSGAVLYGDGATGGVINIVTKDPRDAKSYGKLSVTGGSDDHREANAFMAFSNEQFGLSANYNSSENDGYRDHNHFSQNSGQIDLRVPVYEGEIYLKFGGNQQNIELPGARMVDPSIGLNELSSDRKGSNTLDDWADEQVEYATIGYSAELNKRDSLVIDSGYRRKRQRSQFDYGFGFGAYSESAIRTLSLTPRLMLDREIGGYPVNWVLGIDLYIHEYNSNRSNFKRNVGQPIHTIDVDQKSIALYGQGAVSLSENTSLTAGWRTQKVRQKARDQYDATAPGAAFGSEAANFDETDREESFELGVKHLIADNWTAYGRAGRSARFGTVDELFEFNSMFQQVFSELAPQISRGIEAGISFRNGWLESTLSVFHQEITDEIHFNPATFQNVNLNDTRHQGVELSLEAQVNSSLTLKAGYTYLNAELTAGVNKGNEIPLVPMHTYSVSALADLPGNTKGSVNWNYVSASLFANDLTNTFDKKVPAYQTVDLKLSKEISGLELILQVNNLFDEKYYNFGINSTATMGRFNAYPLPERTAYITASYRFE